ncbi:MAG: preprotein translocase subunit YajC [Planctomycetota bacterium]|jgi:preprotein translocase subunit YajC
MKSALLALPPQNPDQAPESPGGGFSTMLLFMLVLVAVMVLMPLFSRKDRHRQKRVGGLKKHDRVVTSGGIFGTVVSLDEQIVTLEVAKDVRFKVKRSSIHDLERPGEVKEKEGPAKKKAGAQG